MRKRARKITAKRKKKTKNMSNAKSKAIEKKAKEPTFYHQDSVREAWSSGKPFEHEGEKYHVGKMSYGDYFAHPYDKKHPEGRGERDNGGMHRSDVRWFERHPEKKEYYTLK